MAGWRGKLIARIAALGAATMALSACYYDAGAGLGYYDDGYDYGGYDYGRYDCDPYSPFDRYYDCDYRGGFYNIGYRGGWYQDYWYPGYGFYIFDRGGRRYKMYDNHRRYWAGRRYEWYRDRNKRRDGGYGWRNGEDNRRDGERRRDGWRNDDNRREGWRGNDRRRGDGRGDRWRDGERLRGGIPVPQPEAMPDAQAAPAVGTAPPRWNGDRQRRGEDRRREGRRNWQDNGWQGSGNNAIPTPPPVSGQTDAPPSPGRWRRGGMNEGSDAAPRPRMREGNRSNWQAPPTPQAPQGNAAPAPQPRAPRPNRAVSEQPSMRDEPDRRQED